MTDGRQPIRQFSGNLEKFQAGEVLEHLSPDVPDGVVDELVCYSLVTGGNAGSGKGLFKIPVDGGPPVRVTKGEATNPVWSPDGQLIIYTGATVGILAPLQVTLLDGTPVDLPKIEVRNGGERYRFLPDGKSLIYMQGNTGPQDFWSLDIATKKTRRLTSLNSRAAMRTFDITPDGKEIVFDRLRENSDIVLIDLPGGPQKP